MPYFVYEVRPPRRLQSLGAFEQYRDARARARQLRAELPGGTANQVRVIFAKDAPEAERALSQVREPRPLGEEA